MWPGWKTLLLTGASCCWGCQQQDVEGVTINGTLTDQQDYTTNRQMCRLISRSLHHDSQALAALVAFNCGGAALCYDLGDVVTQILYRVGETEFIRMTANFSVQQQRNVRSFVEVGLEYGRYAPHEDSGKSIHEQFPSLDHQLAK
jgi:hypothetical protein